MKKNIFLFIFIFNISAFGQNQYIGLKNGISWANANTEKIFNNDNLKYRIAYSGEIFYQYFYNQNISLTSGFGYNQRGFSIDLDYTDDEGILLKTLSAELDYDYITIPLVIGYTHNGDIHFFGNIGITPSYLISAESREPIVDQNGHVTGQNKYNVKSRVTQFDFGAFTELGIGYQPYNSYIIFSSVSYNHSFNSITNSQYFSYGKINHYGIQLMLGLKYSLN
jgi:hypothetical protein